MRGSAGAPSPLPHPAAAQPRARGEQGSSGGRCVPACGEEEERGSNAAQMKKLPQGRRLPGLSRDLAPGGRPLSPWPWLTRLPRGCPCQGAGRDGTSLRAAPRAAGWPPSLRPIKGIPGHRCLEETPGVPWGRGAINNRPARGGGGLFGKPLCDQDKEEASLHLLFISCLPLARRARMRSHRTTAGCSCRCQGREQ